MRYLDTFSGIGSASLAWQPLGWQCVAHAEVSAFPSAVLKHRFPGVPNLGDCMKHGGWPDEPVELVCGGTPCQSFSVAGLRQGLLDPRGNLTLTFLGIVDQYRPSWVVWENVPGILSHDGGRSLAAVLGALGKLGYRWAYRVLDAQYVRVDGFPYAVPQRRRRLFVVGHIADWRYPAAVLFEPEGLLGYSPPRRKAGQGLAPTISARTEGGGGLIADVHGTLSPGHHGAAGHTYRQKGHETNLIPAVSNALAARDYKLPRAEDNVGIIAVPVSPTMRAGGNSTGGDRPPGTDVDTCDRLVIAHSLKAEGFDASEDGTDRGVPLVASPISANEANTWSHAGNNSGGVHNVVPVAIHTDATSRSGEALTPSPDARGNLRIRPPGKGYADDGSMFSVGSSGPPHAVAFTAKDHGNDALDDCSPTLRAGGHDKSHANGGVMPAVASQYAVRRLTPLECERLQGLPDGWTDVPWRGKEHAPDGPRYKAIGNGWAVNTARWIGYRIAEVEAWIKETGGYR
jgi:DNA (cytosine-5)-methyltransferase 1